MGRQSSPMISEQRCTGDRRIELHNGEG